MVVSSLYNLVQQNSRMAKGDTKENKKKKSQNEAYSASCTDCLTRK